MKNKVLKAVLAIMLIIAITIGDFILLGANLATYALETNIQFTAYFDAESETPSSAEYEMNNDEMKLYLEVNVPTGILNEGAKITLQESNFRIKEEQNNLSEYINSIEANEITLKRVISGNVAIIELDVEPVKDEQYVANMFNKESVLKLSGEFASTEDGTTTRIDKTAKVTMKLTVPSDIDATLDGKTITNKIYKIGEDDRRIVQIELNSALLGNTYPIETTSFGISLPEGVEQPQFAMTACQKS